MVISALRGTARLIQRVFDGQLRPTGRDFSCSRMPTAHSWVEVYIPDRGWVEFPILAAPVADVD